MTCPPGHRAMPGELAVYDDLDKLEEAKSWAAG